MKINRMCAVLESETQPNSLHPLTLHRPVATLPFDCKYRLIDFPLSEICNARVNSVFMVFNEGETQSVFDHIRGGKEWNLDALQNRYFMYFYQTLRKQKEKGERYYGALIDYLEKSKATHACILVSHILCNADLQSILQVHMKQKNEVTVVYKKVPGSEMDGGEHIFDLEDCSGKVLKHSQIAKEDIDPQKKYNFNMELMIVETDWLIKFLEWAMENGEDFYLIPLLYRYLEKVKTGSYEYTGYMKNIHSINSYYQANMDMLNVSKFNSLLYGAQKVYTKVKNEVPTFYDKESEVKDSQFATGGIIEGKVEDSLIGRRVQIQKGASVKKSIIMPDCLIAPNAQVEYAILDKNVVVEENIVIKGLPDAPVVIEKGAVVSGNIEESVLS